MIGIMIGETRTGSLYGKEMRLGRPSDIDMIDECIVLWIHLEEFDGTS